MGGGRGIGLSAKVQLLTTRKRVLRYQPRGRFERSMSRTISTVCSISTIQPERSLEQTGLTSMDIVCHDASNSLCPSNKLDMPALPLQGNSFKNGVRFSVQTTSRGRVPWSRCKYDKEAFEWSPVSSKDAAGRVVRVKSMKLSEAQNRPDRALFKVIHRSNALRKIRHRRLLTKKGFGTLRLFPLPPTPRAPRQSLLPSFPPMAWLPSSQHPIFRN